MDALRRANSAAGASEALLDGYEQFREFDHRELRLVEPLRSLRQVHYAVARPRWDDPALPAAFPWFGTARYWEDRVLELREQIAAMQGAAARRVTRRGRRSASIAPPGAPLVGSGAA